MANGSSNRDFLPHPRFNSEAEEVLSGQNTSTKSSTNTTHTSYSTSTRYEPVEGNGNGISNGDNVNGRRLLSVTATTSHPIHSKPLHSVYDIRNHYLSQQAKVKRLPSPDRELSQQMRGWRLNNNRIERDLLTKYHNLLNLGNQCIRRCTPLLANRSILVQVAREIDTMLSTPSRLDPILSFFHSYQDTPCKARVSDDLPSAKAIESSSVSESDIDSFFRLIEARDAILNGHVRIRPVFQHYERGIDVSPWILDRLSEDSSQYRAPIDQSLVMSEQVESSAYNIVEQPLPKPKVKPVYRRVNLRTYQYEINLVISRLTQSGACVSSLAFDWSHCKPIDAIDLTLYRERRAWLEALSKSPIMSSEAQNRLTLWQTFFMLRDELDDLLLRGVDSLTRDRVALTEHDDIHLIRDLLTRKTREEYHKEMEAERLAKKTKSRKGAGDGFLDYSTMTGNRNNRKGKKKLKAIDLSSIDPSTDQSIDPSIDPSSIDSQSSLPPHVLLDQYHAQLSQAKTDYESIVKALGQIGEYFSSLSITEWSGGPNARVM